MGILTKRAVIICECSTYSSLAQSVERMTVNHDVAGSSPARGATKKPVSQSVYRLFNSISSDSLTWSERQTTVNRNKFYRVSVNH